MSHVRKILGNTKIPFFSVENQEAARTASKSFNRSADTDSTVVKSKDNKSKNCVVFEFLKQFTT